jgi:hypothetical protein
MTKTNKTKKCLIYISTGSGENIALFLQVPIKCHNLKAWCSLANMSPPPSLKQPGGVNSIRQPQNDKTSAAQTKKVGQFHKKLGLDATFNNISVIFWQSILLVEETGVPRENPSTCRKLLTNCIT